MGTPDGRTNSLGSVSNRRWILLKEQPSPRGRKGLTSAADNGAGMRFLLHFLKVAHMTGVDATPAVLAQALANGAPTKGSDSAWPFSRENACATGLPSIRFDFVWGEDAWCYVENKASLIAEAVRLVKRNGRIAFTDWMEGPTRLTASEACRYLGFMKFPNVLTLAEYRSLLESNGCSVQVAHDTGRFAGCMPLLPRYDREAADLRCPENYQL